MALALLTLALGRTAGGAAPDPATLERQLKSAFVVNFVQFIEWPAAAFEKADSPIIIGVVDDSLGESLAAAVEGKTVRGRKLEIRRFEPGAVGKCHVLIAGGLDGDELSAALKNAGGSGVLTIGDSEHLTESGGMIRFYLEDRKMRFEINLAAAERSGLQISSKLLKLAKVVNH